MTVHHQMSASTIACGEELLGWKCTVCGAWIREYGPRDTSTCPDSTVNEPHRKAEQ